MTTHENTDIPIEGDPIQAARSFYAGMRLDLIAHPDEHRETDRVRDFTGVHVAYTDEPGSACADRRPLSDCEAAQAAIADAQEAARSSANHKDGRDTWTTYAWALGSRCVACAVGCNIETAVLVHDGTPTDVTRVIFIKRDESVPTLKLDISDIQRGKNPLIRSRMTGVELPPTNQP